MQLQRREKKLILTRLRIFSWRWEFVRVPVTREFNSGTVSGRSGEIFAKIKWNKAGAAPGNLLRTWRPSVHADNPNCATCRLVCVEHLSRHTALSNRQLFELRRRPAVDVRTTFLEIVPLDSVSRFAPVAATFCHDRWPTLFQGLTRSIRVVDDPIILLFYFIDAKFRHLWEKKVFTYNGSFLTVGCKCNFDNNVVLDIDIKKLLKTNFHVALSKLPNLYILRFPFDGHLWPSYTRSDYDINETESSGTILKYLQLNNIVSKSIKQ